MSRRLTHLLILLTGMLLATSYAATALPYDAAADAKAQVQAGLARAQAQRKHLLVIFGANWCPDCRALDSALQGPVGAQLDTRFVIVKVDVGNFDTNLDVVTRYGNPIKKGIPAAVVVDRADQVLYATQAGELANARRMSASGLNDFFQGVIARLPQARTP